MGRAVRAEQARLRQGPGIAPVGLHLAGARRIHGREVRVRDDDLVAERLQAAGHPFAVGRGLDHNPGAGPGPQHGAEALRLGPDAPLDDLASLGEDVDLAFPLVHVDANMVHGWPLLSAALTAMCSCGALCHHVKREASRFIPSTPCCAGCSPWTSFSARAAAAGGGSLGSTPAARACGSCSSGSGSSSPRHPRSRRARRRDGERSRTRRSSRHSLAPTDPDLSPSSASRLRSGSGRARLLLHAGTVLDGSPPF
jgi:hypothetical protein